VCMRRGAFKRWYLGNLLGKTSESSTSMVALTSSAPVILNSLEAYASSKKDSARSEVGIARMRKSKECKKLAKTMDLHMLLLAFTTMK